MGRTLTPLATAEVRQLLAAIDGRQIRVDEYNKVMAVLGGYLAQTIARAEPTVFTRELCVVCTAEDADFLARGVLEGFEAVGIRADRLRMVCFWNDDPHPSEDRHDLSVTPIVKQYKEDVDLQNAVIVAVSSVLSSTRVLQTNLSSLLSVVRRPAMTIVAAPVMHTGVPEQIVREVAATGSDRVTTFLFALDDPNAPAPRLAPAVGGSLFDRLGLQQRFTLIPEIIKQRRRQFAH